MAVLQEVEPLYKRIRKSLGRSKEPDPAKIARRLRPTLTEEEEEELIAEGLEERVYNEVRIRRARGMKAEYEAQLATRGRAEKQSAEKKRRREAQEEAQYERLREEQREAMRDPIRRAQAAAAERLRSEARRLALSNIYDERVCPGGKWMMLTDCGEAEVRLLADEYAERAIDQAMRGAYYLALAEALREGGYKTVGEMCKAQR